MERLNSRLTALHDRLAELHVARIEATTASDLDTVAEIDAIQAYTLDAIETVLAKREREASRIAAVDAAIASSNRHGRSIGRKEARAIHALLRR